MKLAAVFSRPKCVTKIHVQYIPRNMHTVFALLCFVVVIHWLIFPYPSGLLHWHCGNLTIAPVPAKQPWWIWINISCEFIMNDCITTTKQSTTKPCAYFLGYTVCVLFSYGWPIGDRVLSSSFQTINENAKLVYRQNALEHDIWKMSTIQFRAPYVNSLRPSDTYMSAPSHYMRQCWNIVDWTLRNKLHWNFNRSWNFFI